MPKFRRNFLSLPDVVEANEISSDSEVPNGIISKIRNIVSESNITSYVEPSYNSTVTGNIKTLIKWRGGYAKA